MGIQARHQGAGIAHRSGGRLEQMRLGNKIAGDIHPQVRGVVFDMHLDSGLKIIEPAGHIDTQTAAGEGFPFLDTEFGDMEITSPRQN